MQEKPWSQISESGRYASERDMVLNIFEDLFRQTPPVRVDIVYRNQLSKLVREAIENGNYFQSTEKEMRQTEAHKFDLADDYVAGTRAGWILSTVGDVLRIAERYAAENAGSLVHV